MRREGLLILFGTLLVLITVAWYSKFTINEVLTHSSLDKHDVKEDIARLTQHKRDPEDWRPPTLPSHLQNAHQDDEGLIQHIRDHWIIPPYPAGEWVVADDKKVHYSQIGQSEAVDKLLGQLTDGFFVECGAGDGQFLSNTLFFERQRRWSGLLVEVEPELFEKVLRRKRHAYMINACLSPVQHPVMLNYTKSKLMGGLDSYMAESHKQRITEKKFISGKIEVQCFPLASILKAIRVQQVDYFSLDVEGPEVEILKTIPFNDFKFRTLTVEYRVNGDKAATSEKLKETESLMIGQYGYRQVEILKNLDILLERR